MENDTNRLPKVRPNVEVVNLLKPSDDPTGKAKAMDKEWYISNRVTVGRQLPNGKVRQCSGLIIRPGDFVDVLAVVDIVTYTNSSGRNVRVNFAMKRVIQLKAAATMRKVRLCILRAYHM